MNSDHCSLNIKNISIYSLGNLIVYKLYLKERSMQLHSLTLTNIRSYIKETITFPEGSIMLSGDIGSGKSSILLAIEFSLFGAMRPDLPAEALLRKGMTQGSVELEATIDGKRIMIKRNLKKEQDMIKQTAGYIITNGVKKEGTPVELKAEVMGLLGYPEELVSKNKNYIFRFTVYTPQEDMKYILQESAEVRLDVLRKVFNIDKYKNIRENVQLYLRQMRVEIASVESKVEPLDTLVGQKQQICEELVMKRKEIDELAPQLEALRGVLGEKRKYQELLELAQKQRRELLEQKNLLEASRDEKKKYCDTLKKQDEQIILQLQQLQLPEGKKLLGLSEELRRAEIEKNHFIQRRQQAQFKVQTIQQRMTQIQQELKFFLDAISVLEEKEKMGDEIVGQIADKEEVKDKAKQIEELLEKTLELLTKNKTLMDSAKEVQLSVIGLHHCPMCYQDVSQEHKHKIVMQEQQKVGMAETLLKDLQSKKELMMGQREEFRRKMDLILDKEQQLIRIRTEVIQLREKKRTMVEKQEVLRQLAQENNFAMEQWQAIEKEWTAEQWQQKIEELQKIYTLLLQQQQLEQTLRQVQEQQRILEKESQSIEEKLGGVITQLELKQDTTEQMKQLGEEIQRITLQERERDVGMARLQTMVETFVNRKKELDEIIEALQEEKNKLLRKKEMYNWLEEYFLPLTFTIEKHIMTQIHRTFTEVFAEWFSILIDDSEVYATIDDGFSPVITQNGYEVGFANLSGGERTSVALAYRLALNKVIHEVIQEVKTKELLILDEPTDGFSSEQLDKVREILERMPLKQTIIVSHEAKIETFVQHVIRVGKEGHVSVIG